MKNLHDIAPPPQRISLADFYADYVVGTPRLWENAHRYREIYYAAAELARMPARIRDRAMITVTRAEMREIMYFDPNFRVVEGARLPRLYGIPLMVVPEPPAPWDRY